VRKDAPNRRLRDQLALTVAAASAAAGLVASAAPASAPPVGPLPRGPVTTIVTHPGLRVAVALPRRAASTGLVWRIARPFDGRVVRELSEADVGTSVVVVFAVVRTGRTSLVFGLTRGETPRAYASATYSIRSLGR